MTIERATWFHNKNGYFINVKAHTSAGVDPEVVLTARWRGTGHSSGTPRSPGTPTPTSTSTTSWRPRYRRTGGRCPSP